MQKNRQLFYLPFFSVNEHNIYNEVNGEKKNDGYSKKKNEQNKTTFCVFLVILTTIYDDYIHTK
jgi:hypothetical protein